MNMDIPQSVTTLFFRNRYLLVLSIIVILVGGLSAVGSLPRLEDPRIANRYPIIITSVPGASAERVETLVTEVLEESLQEVEAIEDIESTSRAGVSIIAVELKAEVTAGENKAIFSEIRDQISDALPSLPPEAGVPVIDDKRDPAAFTLIVAVRWTKDTPAQVGILNRLAEDLSDRLRNVDGTELVRLYGNPDEEITVTVDPAEIAELGLSATDISRLIAAADSKKPAGVLRGDRSNVLLEVQGELDSLQRIAAIPLRTGEAQAVVRLADIADVERAWRTPTDEIALVDGQRSVLIAVRMENGQRVDLWAGNVNGVIDEFASMVGSGIVVDRIFEQARYTTTQLSALVKNLLAGAAVVIGVVFVMMGWRLGLIVGLALPLVASIVLFGLQISGNAIHQISIYGMIVALGLLIDNAIVMADEVTKNKATGKTALEAVDGAVRHLFRPLFASTLTTVLAFAPILLLPGGVGDFVSSIGGSVIMALVASFAVAMTITAGLAGILAEPSPADQPTRLWRDGLRSVWLARLYRRSLRVGLRLPVAAILLACFLPVSGFLASRSLGNEFFPPIDRDMFEVQVWLPTDSTIGNTRDQAKEIETVIRDFEATERVYWLVGGSFPTVYYNLVMNKDGFPHYAHAIVTAQSSRAAKEMIDPLQTALDHRFPGAQVLVSQFSQGPPVVADVEYRIYGPSIRKLQDLGEQIRLTLQSHPDVLNTQTTMPRGEPKYWLKVDEDEARLAGLTLGDVSRQLQANLEGSLGGSVIENLEQMPVRVRYKDQQRSSLSRVATMQVVQSGDDWVPLNALGEFVLEPELGGITRFDGERTNIVKGYTRNGALPIDVTREVLDGLEAEGFALPAGYRIELGGAIEQDSQAKGDLVTFAPILLTLAIATLILTFRSLSLALLLGVVAGLSVGLGLLATWLIQFPVSFNTILGTLGLIGLAFNNSIVVLAAIRANPEARAGDANAIAEEIIGTTRHILSTTLTTIGGFLPLLLIVGGDFWPSLAIVLAGGVGGSMILALVFVPAVYVLMCGRNENSVTEPTVMNKLVAAGHPA
jgi:multidrug efflux pump subunit AcrB